MVNVLGMTHQGALAEVPKGQVLVRSTDDEFATRVTVEGGA